MVFDMQDIVFMSWRIHCEPDGSSSEVEVPKNRLG